MNLYYEYFLILAQMLNFTKAAQQLHITQQALSDQIRRLEKSLDTTLFYRRPTVRLTSEGELLYDALLTLKISEQNLFSRLHERKNTQSGTIRFGIHNARAQILLPSILEKYHQEYPNVYVQTVSAQTSDYQQLLMDNRIDFFFGINASIRSGLISDFIIDEPMRLIVSERTQNVDFSAQNIDIRNFAHLPFVFSIEQGQGQSSIENYLARKDILIKPAIITESYITQLELVASLGYACFCPNMFSCLIKKRNLRFPKGERLRIFSMHDYQENLSLSLVRYQKIYFPPMLQRFYEITRKEIRDFSMLSAEK